MVRNLAPHASAHGIAHNLELMELLCPFTDPKIDGGDRRLSFYGLENLGSRART